MIGFSKQLGCSSLDNFCELITEHCSNISLRALNVLNIRIPTIRIPKKLTLQDNLPLVGGQSMAKPALSTSYSYF